MTETTSDSKTLIETSSAEPLLEVRDLQVKFKTHYGTVNAVNGVSFELCEHETLGLLGESGSGKSVMCQAVMGLVPCPPGEVVTKQTRYKNTDLAGASQKEFEAVRGEGIAMVFQDALTSLNPSLTVGYQIAEMYRIRRHASHEEAMNRAVDLMKRVGIPSAEKRIKQYPHQFSGGMRQRVMIAVALVLDPKILIADEPTTALDVTVQRQIMDLLSDLKEERGMSMVLITHDLAVLAEEADRVMVMYAGRLVEKGPVKKVFSNPAHPYTEGLLKSIPSFTHKDSRLYGIPGSPPVLTHIPSGCPFYPRCNRKTELCTKELPQLQKIDDERASTCHYYLEVLNG